MATKLGPLCKVKLLRNGSDELVAEKAGVAVQLRLFMSHSKNHYLGRLDESGGGLAALQVHFAG